MSKNAAMGNNRDIVAELRAFATDGGAASTPERPKIRRSPVFQQVFNWHNILINISETNELSHE